MAYTVEVNSVAVSKPIELIINMSMDKWAGNFTLSFRDQAGTFDIASGHEVVVKDTGTVVWGGYVQRWSRANGVVKASGLDYTSLLTKVYVNEVYTSTAIHSIVTDLMDKYAPNVTYTNVYTTTTTPGEIRFKHVQLFKALQDLAKYDDCHFFIDENKDLHFDTLGSTDSGIDLTFGTNIRRDEYETIDDQLVNKVKITGGREDYIKTETATGDGSTTSFTLTRIPINIRVTQAGIEKIGFKEGMDATADYDYTVDKEAKKVEFNVAPANGEALSFEYTYTSPVIVQAQDDDSISSYGTYERIIYDETINKKEEAREVASQILNKYSQPITKGTVMTTLDLTANLGETVDVTNSVKGIEDSFIVVSMTHSFFLGGRTTTYELASLSEGVVEMLSELFARVDALEETLRGDVDLVSYFRYFKDDATSKAPKRHIVNSGTYDGTKLRLIIGHPTRAIVGTNKIGASQADAFGVYSTDYDSGEL